ncbi:hypothetical protein [Pseudomonas sp. EL_65y_Pfl2_R95]
MREVIDAHGGRRFFIHRYDLEYSDCMREPMVDKLRVVTPYKSHQWRPCS